MDLTSASSGFRALSDPAPLTTAFLHEFAGREDPLGYLSLYLTADPTRQTAGTPAWSVGVRNRLRELRSNLDAAPDRDRGRALAAVLDERSTLVDRFLSTEASGVGRALYLPLSGGEPGELALTIGMGERVVLGDSPFIRPILGAIERGRPTGVALVSRQRLTLWEWRMGILSPISEYVFEADTAHWREAAGYATAQPARAQQTATHLERFRRRIDDHRGRFLDAVGADVADEARDLGWHQTLIYGDPRLSSQIGPALDGTGTIVEHDLLLEHAGVADLTAIVDDRVAELKNEEERALCESLRDRVAGGGAGVLGLGQTLAMLGEGRVEHLLIDESRRWNGTIAPDGRMFAEGVEPAGVTPQDLRADTRMGERMIEAALGQGARVTVLSTDGARRLGDYDSLGAFTRW